MLPQNIVRKSKCIFQRKTTKLCDSAVTDQAFDFHATNGREEQSDAVVRLEHTLKISPLRCYTVKLIVQSTYAISNTRYLKLLLSQTFSLVPSALPVTALTNQFGVSNPTTSNFYYVELFCRSLQCFLELFSILYLDHFHFTYSNVERTHSKTLIECLSFLISTQQRVG